MTPTELKTLCEDLGIERLKVNSRGQISGLCPFHGETRPSWGIAGHKEKHPFNCYGCHETGTLALLVMRLKELTPKQAIAYIKLFGEYDDFDVKDAGTSLINFLTKPKTVIKQPVPDYLFAPYRGKAARFYLAKRGIRLTFWSAGFVNEPGYDPDEQRILYPWYDDGFRGCTGHYVGKDKYIKENARSLPYFELQKGEHLFNPFFGAKISRKLVIVVEGEVDSYKVAQAVYGHLDIPHIRAIGNSRASDKQLKKIIALGVPILPLFDDDEAGRDGKEHLTEYCREAVPVLDDYKYPRRKGVKKKLDPGELTSPEILEIIRCARSKPLL